MRSGEKHSARLRARAQRSALLKAYPVRIMLGLVASLGILILAVRLPLYELPPAVSWGPAPTDAPIALKDLREAEDGASTGPAPDGALLSSFGATDIPAADSSETGGREEETAGSPEAEEASSDAQKRPRLSELPGTAQLHTLNQKPRAIGGIGSVYLKIDYPEAARRDSIEGRLLLYFIVEKDGSTSHVQVAQSLHPLCDSSAVRAVRRTRFIPGQRDGKAVRVPMHLPVRFKLVEEERPLQANRSPSDTSGR